MYTIDQLEKGKNFMKFVENRFHTLKEKQRCEESECYQALTATELYNIKNRDAHCPSGNRGGKQSSTVIRF